MFRRRTPSRPSGPRAFTLLELILALAIFLSISLLIATMWSQAASWADDDATDLARIRLERALTLIRDQWSTRTNTAQLDDFGSAVATTHSTITFTSTTPILFPTWPIVLVEYSIERDLESHPGRTGLWKVAYSETRLSSPAAAPGDDAAEGRPSADAPRAGRDYRTMTLLGGCTDLAIERFGPLTPPSLAPKTGDDAKDAAAAAAKRKPSEPQSHEGEVGNDEAEQWDEEINRWRPYTAGDAGLIPAIRLTGTWEGERFGCVFIIAASR